MRKCRSCVAAAGGAAAAAAGTEGEAAAAVLAAAAAAAAAPEAAAARLSSSLTFSCTTVHCQVICHSLHDDVAQLFGHVQRSNNKCQLAGPTDNGDDLKNN